LKIPSLDITKIIELNAFEILTFKLNLADKSITEVDLMENDIK